LFNKRYFKHITKRLSNWRKFETTKCSICHSLQNTLSISYSTNQRAMLKHVKVLNFWKKWLSLLKNLFLSAIGGQFHQRSTSSFYTSKSWKSKNRQSNCKSFFCLRDLRALKLLLERWWNLPSVIYWCQKTADWKIVVERTSSQSTKSSLVA